MELKHAEIDHLGQGGEEGVAQLVEELDLVAELLELVGCLNVLLDLSFRPPVDQVDELVVVFDVFLYGKNNFLQSAHGNVYECNLAD